MNIVVYVVVYDIGGLITSLHSEQHTFTVTRDVIRLLVNIGRVTGIW